MIFNRYNILIAARVSLLFSNLLGIALLITNTQLWFTIICLGILALIQVFELIWYMNAAQRELSKFLMAVKYEDYSVSFSDKKGRKHLSQLSEAFQEIVEKLRLARIDKESQLQLFKTLLEKLSIGVIVFNAKEDRIVVMNQSASRLLGIPFPKYWSRLKKREPGFTDGVEEIQFGGRKLVTIEEQGMKKELSVDVSFVKIQQIQYTVVAFQDIRDEIEQKEVEAWHKLIRILTHEIMNSITPVSSLSETMMGMLQTSDKQVVRAEEIDDDSLEDLLLAVNTINKRSNGMLEFVNDYRKLTRIPAPTFEMIRVSELFDNILFLFKTELAKLNIEASIDQQSQHIFVKCDIKLIEQVVINLFRNSFHALKNAEHPRINLSAEATDKRIFIRFSDNGAGIEKDKMERIFIPFYSTKSDGSGIGLSLSKNIMQLHQGTITVHSVPNEETTFTLNFPNHAFK